MTSKIYLYLFLITLLFSFSFAKSKLTADEIAEKEELAEEERLTADAAQKGALRVGKLNTLIPDASSENPMIISTKDQQPLCLPDITLTPSRDIKVLEGYNFRVLANTIKNPRKIIVDQADHVLVMSPGEGLYSIRSDKCGNTDIKQILTNDKMDQPIGHGVALFDRHIFVSTADSVYKFPYSDGQHSPIENGVKILTNINPKDPNATPDVAIDPFGHAFIPRTVSELHEKLDSSHAIIKKFNLRIIPERGYDYEKDGEVHALGTNTYGSMGFDTQARLWGINGLTSDKIQRSDFDSEKDLASGIAEELNLYEFKSTNYGFPYCMTEFDLKDISSEAKGLGAQWGHPTFMNDSISLDEYCQEEENNRAPAVPLAPNSYATTVHFYMGNFCSVGDLTTQGSSVGLPCNWTDTPIVANHGIAGQSGGHNVVRLQFDDLGHKPRWDKKPDVLIQETEPCTGTGCISPYGLAVDSYGRLLVSSDETNEIFLMSRIFNDDAVKLLTEKMDDDSAAKDAKGEEGGSKDGKNEDSESDDEDDKKEKKKKKKSKKNKNDDEDKDEEDEDDD